MITGAMHAPVSPIYRPYEDTNISVAALAYALSGGKVASINIGEGSTQSSSIRFAFTTDHQNLPVYLQQNFTVILEEDLPKP
jgi:hypothetical protein